MEGILKLKCGCGQDFERPEHYQVSNDRYPNVVFKWKLKYCDVCYKTKAEQALKRLPEILNNLIDEKD